MIQPSPQQFDILSRAGPAAAERALMRAVLADAIQCLAGETGPLRERALLASDARAWVEDDDQHWPFSFPNLCDALGFSAGTLRVRLLRTAPTPVLDGAQVDVQVARRSRPAVAAEPEVVAMIRAGHPLRVVAEWFGISVSKVSILSGGLASRMRGERDEEIRGLRGQGWTHRALASHFALSRIRVMRICARREPTDGGRRSAA